MHDGAVLIYRNKIKATRCILPITERQNLPPNFGLRHRAAIGMTEATNVLVLVVSEETGQISIVQRGNILPNLSSSEIRNEINKYFES
jgi:diadenylate cyclase